MTLLIGVYWSRNWQPTPIFLPGEFHGQRSLAGYSPWGRKESDSTEQLTLAPEPSPAQDPGRGGFGTLLRETWRCLAVTLSSDLQLSSFRRNIRLEGRSEI